MPTAQIRHIQNVRFTSPQDSNNSAFANAKFFITTLLHKLGSVQIGINPKILKKPAEAGSNFFSNERWYQRVKLDYLGTQFRPAERLAKDGNL